MTGKGAVKAPRGQLMIFAMIYISYVGCYLGQKNYAFWLQALISEEGWKKEEVGGFGSAFQISSAASKLFNGPIVDAMSPKQALASTLLVIGLCNLLIFTVESPSINFAIWAVNGAFQGAAWPALTRIFMNWFPDPAVRGTWYGLLSTNQNMGSTLVPLALPALMKAQGWRFGTQGPGCCCIAISLLLFLTLQDYPSDQSTHSAKPQKQPKGGDKKDKTNTAEADSNSDSDSSSFRLLAMRLTLLGLGYLFISIIRQGLADWSAVVLEEEKKLSPVQAGRCMAMLEMGALCSGLTGGFISDKIFKGARAAVMCIFISVSAPLVYAAFIMDLSDLGDTTTVMAGLYFVIGFFTFAPHVLIGLFARELCPSKPSTAGGFVKALGQIGGAFAGAPLMYIVASYDWKAAFYLWVAAGVCAGLCFLPLWSVKPTKAVSAKKKTQ